MAGEKSDSTLLVELLRHPKIKKDLDHLHDSAMDCSIQALPGDCYDSPSKPFCDGYEIYVGELTKTKVLKSISTLRNRIQNRMEDLILKNVLPVLRKEGTCLWLTLNPETAHLTPTLIMELMQTVEEVKKHARIYWLNKEEPDSHIGLTKIDVAVDVTGAFLPAADFLAYPLIKEILIEALDHIFENPCLNFLAGEALPRLKVLRGDGILASCYQYNVMDDDKNRLLTVKIYDKVLDLIGHEFRHVVSSRTS